MEKFAFIFHPLTLEDMEHLSPVMKYIPDPIIEACLKMKKPFKVSHITGVKSPYAEAEGWFIGCVKRHSVGTFARLKAGR